MAVIPVYGHFSPIPSRLAFQIARLNRNSDGRTRNMDGAQPYLEYTRYINLLMIYRKIIGLKEILNGELKLWQIFLRRRRWGVGRSDLGQIPQILLIWH